MLVSQPGTSHTDGVLEQQSSSLSIPTTQAGTLLRASQFGSFNGIYKRDVEQMKDSFHLKCWQRPLLTPRPGFRLGAALARLGCWISGPA